MNTVSNTSTKNFFFTAPLAVATINKNGMMHRSAPQNLFVQKGKFEAWDSGSYPLSIHVGGKNPQTVWGNFIVRPVVGGKIVEIELGGKPLNLKGVVKTSPKIKTTHKKVAKVKTTKKSIVAKAKVAPPNKPTAYKLEGYNKEFGGKFALVQHYRQNTPKRIKGALPQILALKNGIWVADGCFSI